MTTKLEIIGPYTPEHEGPYAIDSAMSEEALWIKANVHCVVDRIAFVTTEDRDGPWCTQVSNLMNAREVPVAREFWINEFKDGVSYVYPTEEEASRILHGFGFIRTIHVREVLEGEEV